MTQTTESLGHNSGLFTPSDGWRVLWCGVFGEALVSVWPWMEGQAEDSGVWVFGGFPPFFLGGGDCYWNSVTNPLAN